MHTVGFAGTDDARSPAMSASRNSRGVQHYAIDDYFPNCRVIE
ncbi:hypothetical protein [Peterkaempfera sp. SMS 1(5)a]